MNSNYVICKNCGHRIKIRTDIYGGREIYGGRYYRQRRRCSKCHGSHFLELTKEEIDYYLSKGFIQAIKESRTEFAGKHRSELKQLGVYETKRSRRAAPRVEPQVEEIKPTLDLGPKHPECFGKYDLNSRICETCDDEHSFPCMKRTREIKNGGKIK